MFDHVADKYDQSFTHAMIGRLQRASVMDYINSVLPTNKSLRILELNCGTGEDAIYFAKKGHHVVATDLSEKMIEVAKQKAIDELVDENIETFPMDMRNIYDSNISGTFDLVFSNFGGINCLNNQELKILSNDLVSLMKPTGRLISVIMPKNCLWENLYFTAKFDWEKVFRRNTNQMLAVDFGKHIIPTWYYSPSEIGGIFKNNFTKIAQKPIGFAVPPSYMEPFFQKRRKALKILSEIENGLNHLAGLAAFSDHFLIDLKFNTAIPVYG